MFVKHYAPNCLTLTLLDSQHCLPMMVTTVQIYKISMLFYQKGNNSKTGDNLDKKKIQVTYFLLRNQYMKFQNISIHDSKLMLYTIKQQHISGRKLQRTITLTFHLSGSKFNQVISFSIPISRPNIMALA